MEGKPKRSIITAAEKLFVAEAVAQNPIVHSAATDSASILRKKVAWEKITELYNEELTHTPKTLSQVKKMWENIKQSRKSELTRERQDTFLTGGGSRSAGSAPSCSDADSLLDAIDETTDLELIYTVDSDSALLLSRALSDSLDIVAVDWSTIQVPEKTKAVESPASKAGTAAPSAPSDCESGSRKRKVVSQDEVVASELKARKKREERKQEQELELYLQRKKELEVRLDIANIEKKDAEDYATHKQKLWGMEEVYQKARYASLLEKSKK